MDQARLAQVCRQRLNNGSAERAPSLEAAAAADVALFLVGKPGDDEMIVALLRLHADMAATLETSVGAEIAGLLAAAFVVTVVRRRAEIEAGGATPRVLN
jgi:hypothetical protein